MLSTGTLMSQESALDGDMTYYNRADGLPQIHVFDIAEDSLGFMYFATMYGLSRFDGFNFVNYEYIPDDSLSLSGNFVTSLLIDSKERMWVSTRTGLNLFDPVTEKSQRLLHEPNNDQSPAHNFIDGLAEDNDGLIYYTHKRGVDSYNPVTKEFKHYFHKDFDIMRHVGDVVVDQSNTVWASAMNGIYRVDVDRDTLDFFPMDSIPDASYAKVLDMIITDDDDIWVAGRFGIAHFDPSSGTYDIKEANMAQSAISLWLNSDGTIYIGGSQDGFTIFDPKSNQKKYQRNYDAADPAGMMSNTVYSIYKDSRNTIWLGLFNGVNRISTYDPRYQLIRFATGVQNLENSTIFVTEDYNRTLWVNTMRGLRYKKKNSPNFEKIEAGLSTNDPYLPILSLASTKDKTYLDLQNLGIHEYHADRRRVVPHTTAGLFDNKSVQLHTDRFDDHKLYVATSNGLCHWNPSTQDTSWIRPIELSTSLENNRVRFLIQKGSLLYFINSNKLCLYDRRTQRINVLDDPTNALAQGVRQMVASDDELIIRTPTFIIAYHIPTSVWRTMSDLPSDYSIISMEVDGKGTLWLSSGTSLLALDKGAHAPKAYAVPQGFTFDPACRTASGHVAFETLEGLIYIDPVTFYRDSTKPKVILTGVDIFDEPMRFDKATNYVEDITLEYDERSIAIHFAALHFRYEEHITYSYRLLEVDDDWRSNGTDRRVSYANLDHGDYTFEVKAKTEDGAESAITRLHITVKTPFQKSTLFYALIGLGSLLIATWLYINHRRILDERKRKEVAENSAKHKSMFLAHMSHEIRTPLNAILGLNQLLLDSELSTQNKRYAESIAISCDNLLMIVNDILDQSKIEHGEYVIDHKPFSLEDLLTQLETLFKSQADRKGLDLAINLDRQVPKSIVGDPVRLFQVLTNLLGNAIKFTSVGRVDLEVELLKQNIDNKKILQFTIRDTGIGIADDKIDDIFKSFGQLNEMEFEGNQGTGLGLSIVQDIVQKMNGSIRVESTHGLGSAFFITLPFAPHDAAIEKQSRAIAANDTVQLKILLVEDTKLNQVLIVDIVKNYLPNCTLNVVNNGEEALAGLAAAAYDLILMDVRMPVMDGIEATKRIRQLRDERAATYIIGLTANAIPQQVQECRMAGMNDVMTKPIRVATFIEKLSKLKLS